MIETFSVKDLAKILGYSTNTVYKYLKEKKIKSIRFGNGRFHIPQEEIERINPSFDNSTEKLLPRKKNETQTYSKSPDMFKWFLATVAVVFGLSMIILSEFTYFQILLQGNRQNIFNAVRMGLFFGGLGYMFTLMFKNENSFWQKMFQLIIGLIYLFLAYLSLADKNSYGVVAFGVLGICIFWDIVGKIQGEWMFGLYLGVMLFVSPYFIYLFNPDQANNLLAGLFQNRNFVIVFSLAWIFFICGYFVILRKALNQKNKLLYVLMSVLGIICGIHSVFYANQVIWDKAFFTIVLSLFCFLTFIWNRFAVTKSSQKYVFFLVFIIITLIFVLIALFIWLFQSQISNYAVSDLNRKTEYANEVVMSQHMEIIESLETLSRNPLLGDELESKRDNNSVLIGLARGFYESNKNIRRILILDETGYDLVVYPFVEDTFGKNYSYRDYFQKALIEKKTYTSDAFIAVGGPNTPVVVVSVPIFSSKNKKPVGVLVGSIDFLKIGYQLQKFTQGDKEYFSLTDSKGNYLIHPQPNMVGTSVEKENPANLALQGQNGVQTYYDKYLKTRVFVSYRNHELNSYKWALSYTRPVNEVLHISNFYSAVVLLFLSTTCLIIVLSLFMFFSKSPQQ
jgi:excisionase family DNA binding protein